ncbi:hypothetical protein CO038_02855 [Candidatus Pacearchaeota archaeon CG_4_9_14_0_2_um_filter_39_13]|nr:MAG: hypothetical protein CO038_02855 [Candidatus Pacearchaeota archaeon CG_4_9_14_0_2_um_filter_39_13]
MEKRVIFLFVILAFLVLSLGVYVNFHYLESDSAESELEKENLSCDDLGCFANTAYVGSINSDIYYPCGCRYAKTINPENVICFSSEEDAEDQGYIRSEC